jgi:hypothetical protein
MSDDDRIKSLIVDVIHSMSNDMADRIKELEADLAKATGALEEAEYELLLWAECKDDLDHAGFTIGKTLEVAQKITATIAELKGEK